jgi:hypothetical protein
VGPHHDQVDAGLFGVGEDLPVRDSLPELAHRRKARLFGSVGDSGYRVGPLRAEVLDDRLLFVGLRGEVQPLVDHVQRVNGRLVRASDRQRVCDDRLAPLAPVGRDQHVVVPHGHSYQFTAQLLERRPWGQRICL